MLYSDSGNVGRIASQLQATWMAWLGLTET